MQKPQCKLLLKQSITCQLWNVNYHVKGSSNNIKTGVSREIMFQKTVHFGHFISRFVFKTTETPVFLFSLLRLFDELLIKIIDDP